MQLRRPRFVTAAFLLVVSSPLVSRAHITPSAHPQALPPIGQVDAYLRELATSQP